ncbi:long polar fimbrial protein LpfA [Buttiauxella agrestis]|uniref:Long polar fimbrial protein LpfA n=1 Tax=Buttiauxella agrestis TaxID=82977 RepID=A0A381C767_9ENTR|nr:fimbrial protein [Buttiauxella agrestis]SUW63738.1 long polar fimbrial protein LpfA [Buttiauxella agrestis]
MNTNLKDAALAALMSLALAGAAQAADVTINISGKIVASPCVVDGSSDINVDLGQTLQAADLSTAGSTSSWVPFTISMKNCPTSTTNVIATFGGTGDAADLTRLYTNTGTASNVAVELQSNDASNTPLGNTKSMTIPRTGSNTAVFPLQSRVWSKGNASTGTVASVVSVAFTYN